MAFNDIEYQAVSREVKQFVDSVSPPAHARNGFDIVYSIADQTVDIGEQRPVWKGDPRKPHVLPLARIRYVSSKNLWRLYRMRQDLSWRMYATMPTLTEALELVREDRHGCFWG